MLEKAGETARDRAATTKRKGPLAGLRIIEIGQMLAGPFVGSRMADFGAEVIKVEAPDRTDPMRVWGMNKYKGKGLWWPLLARNKKLITANLRDERGSNLIKRLCETADGLIENFRPGMLEKWGLGPEELHKINPGLVITRVSGFGQDGPYAQRPGFASGGEAMGGIRYLNGFPGEPPPRTAISIGDTLTGMFAAQGMLMALYWRDGLGGGKGQVVDATILESCFTFIESALPDYDKCGAIRQPGGTGLPGVVPSNIYKSKDGLWMVIAANVDEMYQRFCTAIERPELARHDTHDKRAAAQEEVEAAITAWAATKTAEEIDDILNQHNVVCAPINTIKEVAENPQLVARNMIRRVQDDFFGDVAMPGIVPLLDQTPGDIEWLGSTELGAHNQDVYGDILGLTNDEMAELKEQGII